MFPDAPVLGNKEEQLGDRSADGQLQATGGGTIPQLALTPSLGGHQSPGPEPHTGLLKISASVGGLSEVIKMTDLLGNQDKCPASQLSFTKANTSRFNLHENLPRFLGCWPGQLLMGSQGASARWEPGVAV